MEKKLIGEFQKNSQETLRVTLQAFNGHPLVDIRIWLRMESGEWIATRKGVAIDPDLLPQLEKLLHGASEEYEQA